MSTLLENAFALAADARRRRRKSRRKPTTGAAGDRINTLLSPTQRTGLKWEEHAADFVQQQGLAILARNLCCKLGEIDLVALDPAGTLIFIEVRQRQNRSHGRAADTVTLAKQQRLIRTAQYLLPRIVRSYLRGRIPVCRFDVIGYDGSNLTWIRAAFSASDKKP